MEREKLYRYKCRTTAFSSALYGNCEVCGKYASEVFIQIAERRFTHNGKQHFTQRGCDSSYGHQSCLIGLQKDINLEVLKIFSTEMQAAGEAIRSAEDMRYAVSYENGFNDKIPDDLFIQDVLKGKIQVEPAREITVIPVGTDGWDRAIYMNQDNKRIYAVVDGRLHTTTADGEPDCPLRLDLKINILTGEVKQ